MIWEVYKFTHEPTGAVYYGCSRTGRSRHVKRATTWTKNTHTSPRVRAFMEEHPFDASEWTLRILSSHGTQNAAWAWERCHIKFGVALGEHVLNTADREWRWAAVENQFRIAATNGGDLFRERTARQRVRDQVAASVGLS